MQCVCLFSYFFSAFFFITIITTTRVNNACCINLELDLCDALSRMERAQLCVAKNGNSCWIVVIVVVTWVVIITHTKVAQSRSICDFRDATTTLIFTSSTKMREGERNEMSVYFCLRISYSWSIIMALIRALQMRWERRIDEEFGWNIKYCRHHHHSNGCECEYSAWLMRAQ